MTRLALTLWPEWAWAVAHLGKDIENRDWMRESLIGQWLCSHGGVNIGGRPATRNGNAWREALDEVGAVASFAGCPVDDIRRLTVEAVNSQGRGIVAVCKIAGFVTGMPKGWFVGSPGYGWQLRDVTVLTQPVPCKGAQGLWPVPADLLDAVLVQLEHSRAGK